ncbi:MAG: serine/threonine protein kinase [Gemmatales bacterium]|nr:serine/threonine protein kinase [Gemmatales bacterium]MDW8385658.1 serine/threonine-protein kinase [Gemmatales bacterium]
MSTEPQSRTSTADLSGRRLGDFLLVRRLGEGGMGTVYLAEQVSLRRRVAVKVLRTDTGGNETSRKRFRAEAEAVARLNHANIVQLYQFHDETQPQYMVLEFVDGWNLREYLARKGPPGVATALGIMWQVASALQRAAEMGIVHRDIKPENILITRKGEVKVADFGLSRMLYPGNDAKHLTQTGVTLGTPLYMSPEQVEGRPTDHRTDIYAFGATCYHLLAGCPPFEGENAFAVALQHVQKEPIPLDTLRPDLPAELCALIHRMLAKKPDDRPSSAAEVLRELQAISERLPKDQTSPALTSLTLSLPVAESTAMLPTLIQSGSKTGLRTMPAWLTRTIWLATIAGSLFFAYVGGAWTAAALRPHVEEPPVEPTDTVQAAPLETLLGSYRRKERGYRDLIEETENPGREREELRRGIQHRMDLGLLYLEQIPRELDRAEELFAAQMKSKVREYEYLGKVGMAMVLAFRDEPEKSNQLLVEAINQQREGAAPTLPPNLRWLRMLLTALEHNKRNCQAQKLRYPPELVVFEANLRRFQNFPGPIGGPPGPAQGPPVERPRPPQ